MFRTDGQHNNSHFSNRDNGAQVRANLPKTMQYGGWKWWLRAKLYHSSGLLCKFSSSHYIPVSVLSRQMSSTDMKVFPSWLWHHSLHNQHQGSPAPLRGLWGRPSCFTSGELLWRGREKEREESGRLGNGRWPKCLSRRLCNLIWQPRQQLSWVFVCWSSFAAKAGRSRPRANARPWGERGCWETRRGRQSTSQTPAWWWWNRQQLQIPQPCTEQL